MYLFSYFDKHGKIQKNHKFLVRTPLKLTQNHKSRGTKKCLARFKPLLTQTVAG